MTLFQVAEWIECHLSQPITVRQLADIAGYSSRHLSMQFKHAFHISMHAYIQKRRLTLAAAMLRDTRRQITEVAMMYQFSHLPSFSRAFRKQFGQSPLQYQQATSWDMSLFYPSAAVTGYPGHTDIISLPEGAGLVPVSNKEQKLYYGFDFFHIPRNGKITASHLFYQEIIALIFREETPFPLTVYGETFPGEKSDSLINVVLGHFTPRINEQNAIPLPPGQYACFTFTGTPEDIMQYHIWAKGHGMHACSLILKKGPTFSIFDKANEAGKYKTEYYIPCITP